MANRNIELSQCIFFDASDALELQFYLPDDDAIDCSQCGEEHSTSQMFVEQMKNIQAQSQELENRLCECVEGCACGSCRFSEVNDEQG